MFQYSLNYQIDDAEANCRWMSKLFLIYLLLQRRGARVVELATLERWYTGNGIVGSNPTLSADTIEVVQGFHQKIDSCRNSKNNNSERWREWLKPPVSKTGIPARVSRVRIPPSPQMSIVSNNDKYIGLNPHSPTTGSLFFVCNTVVYCELPLLHR